MKKEESKLLGEILRKSDVTLLAYGIDVDTLTKGESNLTYDEMQYVLKDNPSSHILSVDLKRELSTS